MFTVKKEIKEGHRKDVIKITWDWITDGEDFIYLKLIIVYEWLQKQRFALNTDYKKWSNWLLSIDN